MPDVYEECFLLRFVQLFPRVVVVLTCITTALYPHSCVLHRVDLLDFGYFFLVDYHG